MHLEIPFKKASRDGFSATDMMSTLKVSASEKNTQNETWVQIGPRQKTTTYGFPGQWKTKETPKGQTIRKGSLFWGRKEECVD